jgi:putative transposase
MCLLAMKSPIKKRKETLQKTAKHEKRSSTPMESSQRRQAYPSDLTDEQWAILEPLIPAPAEDATHLIHSRREIINAILYVLRSGCPWRLLPHDFPKWQTVYDYFREWRRAGIWDQVLQTLRVQVRTKQGRNAEPSAAIIDSQSIKTSAVRGPQKGYDAGKRIWGRKRHLLVDTQGNLLGVHVIGADSSDLQGAQALLLPLKDAFPIIKVLWGDSHYGGTLIGWVKVHLGWIVQVVRGLKVPKRGLLVPEGEEVDWDKLFPKGFRPLPKRWIIERNFAWIIRWRRLCRDHEGLPQSSEAFIKLSACRRMLTKLAPAFLS